MNPLAALIGREIARRTGADEYGRSPAEMTDAEILQELARIEAAYGSRLSPDELRLVADFADEVAAKKRAAAAPNNFR